jgi:hypothetical protein
MRGDKQVEEKEVMKIQEFAYNVVQRTMELLEEKQHYKIPEATRKEIQQQIRSEMSVLMKQK